MSRDYGEKSGSLFADWKAFAVANGEEPGSAKRFKAMLEKVPGVQPAISPAGKYRGRGFLGIRLIPAQSDLYDDGAAAHEATPEAAYP